MTSRGIGDARRVLGQPTSWVEHTFHPQLPEMPAANGDPLVDFLCYQIRGWENQVVTEANEYRSQPLGGALTRYAMDIREQCSAIRRVLVRYAEARAAGALEAAVLREVLADLATRFSGHPSHRDEWPPPG